MFIKFEVDKIFPQAHGILSVYCEEDETPNECILRHFPKEEFDSLSAIFEFKIRPFEASIYVICCLDEDIVYMIVATKQDAIKSENFILIDEISKFQETFNCRFN
jgi:hypothetical protein